MKAEMSGGEECHFFVCSSYVSSGKPNWAGNWRFQQRRPNRTTLGTPFPHLGFRIRERDLIVKILSILALLRMAPGCHDPIYSKHRQLQAQGHGGPSRLVGACPDALFLIRRQGLSHPEGVISRHSARLISAIWGSWKNGETWIGSLPPLQDGHQMALDFPFGQSPRYTVYQFPSFEEVEGGSTPDTIFRGYASVLIHIQFGDFHPPGIFGSQLIQYGRKPLTVPAPGGKKLQ